MEDVSLHVDAGDGGGPISVLTISGLISALLKKKKLNHTYWTSKQKSMNVCGIVNA